MSKLHRIDTSTLKPGECCTHNCNEGRDCHARIKSESRAYRAKVWCWYTFPVMLVTALAWVAVAVWLWRMV